MITNIFKNQKPEPSEEIYTEIFFRLLLILSKNEKQEEKI